VAVTSARVFRDYTQDELDRAYDQRAWAPNADEVIARYATASAAARARLRREADLPYGATPDETLDWFPTAAPDAPVLVFVHGGAWRGGRKEQYSFPAEPLVAAGAHYVALDFASIPRVRLPEMAAQVQRATAWVSANARRFGGDPGRLYLAGHSSGAHLAAVAAALDGPDPGVTGVLCVSGTYDLRATLLSARSGYIELGPEEADRLSPSRHAGRIRCPVVLAHGGRESPEFRRMAVEFDAALRAAGRPSELVVAPGLNHFEILETLGRPDGLLARVVLRQMGLA
jgi:arylformamidase